MIEYLNFFLLWTLLCYLCTRTKRYSTLLKIVEESIDNLISSGYDDDDFRRQKLLECILTGNSKQYLNTWVRLTLKNKLKKLSAEEVDKLFSNYEAKLSGQMVKSLGKLIISMYSMGACAVLGISNQDALSEDLETDPFQTLFFKVLLVHCIISFVLS